MQLTRFTDIGLRVVMRLAAGIPAADASGDASADASAPEAMTTKQLATELAVPYTHVTKVTSRLSEMGVIHTRRGRTGGVAITELGRSAPVGWLARSLEGEGEVVECGGPQPCPLRGACRLRGALAAAQEAFFAALDEHTIGDLTTPAARAVLLTLTPPGRPRPQLSVADPPST